MGRLAPPPRLTLSEWADRHRRLSSESAGEPGRWSTKRAAYQREMMDVLTDPRVEQVVLMTGARVGKTQACINNLVGFHMHQDPCNLMVVLPTEARGDEWVDDELDPMIRDTPALRGVLGERKSRAAKDRRRHRAFPGGRLYVAGTNAPSALAAKTVRVLMCDEVDRYPSSAGREGDPVDLAIRRTATIWNRKIVLSSTPTFAGCSRIERAFLASDQRRFWVPCAACGEFQVLRWEQVRWDTAADGTASLRSVRYHCASCGVGWTDGERWAAVRQGEWRAARPFAGIAGFHICELYAPWRRLSATVADFLQAKGNPNQLMVWKNTALGEPWQESGDAPDWERLLERREPFPMGIVPRRARVLTMGVDNQAAPARLEVAVWAWAEGYESWLVDTAVIEGDPAGQTAWDQVAALLRRDWPREGGGIMRIAAAGVDTGGQHTAGVYAQLRRLHDPRVIPMKGVGGWTRASPVNGPTMVDVTQGGRKITRGLKLWTVSVDVFKAELYRRLWLTRGENAGFPAGWVHLPEAIDGELVKQLTAERLVPIQDRRGFQRHEWQKMRANEQLDLAVYARAALTVLGSDRYGGRFWGMADRWRTEAGLEPDGAAEPFEAPTALVGPAPPPVVPAPVAPQPPAPAPATPQALHQGPQREQYVEPRGPTITVAGEAPGQQRRRSIASRLA